MKFGLIVDVETTGLNPSENAIIELGLLEFKFGDAGEFTPVISSMYSSLQDPGEPLSDEVKQLTGLDDTAVRGQEIDWSVVRRYWDRANLVIAHNAEFDRSFLMMRRELTDQAKHWACSVRHIDWRAKKFSSAKLNYLAADHGFVNPFAHRALFDCATTYRLISPHLEELMKSSHEPEIEISAFGSPFESKDVLRANGYRWDAQERVWRKKVSPSRLDAERRFLSQDVYKGPTRHSESESYFNIRH
jgi:DNA polymerase III subunit epsilon